MMGDQEEKVGGASGLIAEDVGDGMSARSPHLARGWQVAGEGGWAAAPDLKVEVDAKHVSSEHDAPCDERDAREQALREQADKVLEKWAR